jgi:probable DNA repair protein
MSAVAAGSTVLTPNTELAAALFDAAERTYQESGREIWPTPRVRDFGGWLREGYVGRQLEDAATPRALSDIEERELWRAVIDSSEAGRDMLDPGGAARAARRARRALHEYGIPLQAVADQASAFEESQVFLGWNHEFSARCRQLDCISGDELLSLAPSGTERIAWIESPAWRPMARRWLQRHGRMLLPPVHPGPAASRLNAASPAAELAAMGEWAAANLRADARFRAWICLPDLSRRRAQATDALDAALAPQRFALTEGSAAAPYAVAGGTPLAEFAPVRAALDLLAAGIDATSFESFSALLRAPELQAGNAELAAATLLDVQLRKQGPDEAGAAVWLTVADRIAVARGLAPVAALQRLHNAFRALDELRGSQPMSRWVGAWITAFEAGPWSLRHRWSSMEFQAAERFRELLAMLAAADSFFGTQSRRSAQLVLRRATLDTPFQAQTGVPPIWVSGQLIDPWLNYQGLWVSGCTAERWPPPPAPIPLLPIGLQRDFGVIAASAEWQLKFALDLQDRWAARAGQCVFSYAAGEDGRAAAPSPLLPEAVSLLPAAQPRPHWHALMRTRPALERFTDELAPPLAGDERARGVATLRSQSRCAFRGFAEWRLKCEQLEIPVPGFNERERGELIHDALEQIWSVLRDSNGLQSIAADAKARLLNESITRALAKVCRRRDPGPRWRLRERGRMQGVLEKWLEIEKLREPFEVEQLEPATEPARHAGLEFRVRIDRVDRLADGSRVLIDYKTGRPTADWRGERPDNPQLPIYALLRPEALVAVAYGRVNAAECTFVAETERRAVFKPWGQPSTLEGMPSLAALIEVWSGRIAKLAADFAAGHAAVAPTVHACKTCFLHGLCRVPAALDDEAESHD